MSSFVESLKRLFKAEKVSIEKLNELLSTGKINQSEYDYIKG